MKLYWVLPFVLAPVVVMAANQPLSGNQATAWGGVFKSLPGILKSLRTQDALPILVALCNVMVALLKTEWFQALALRITRSHPEKRLTPAGKVSLALLAGVLVTFSFSPASTDFRTLGKGLMVGFAAMGAYTTWKHTLRGVFIKEAKVPEETQHEKLVESAPPVEPEVEAEEINQ